MTDYFMAFVLTDSEMKKNTDEIQIVKRENLTPDILTQFVPFCGAYIVGEEDTFGRIIQGIEGNKNKITVSGVTMVGVMPLPFSEEYAVGENFTANNIFEINADGSGKRVGFAKIERIIVCKTKNDTNEIVNYFAEVNANHGRPVMYAEESTSYGDASPAASQAAEDVGEIIDTCYECSNPIYIDDARCRNCGSWDVDSDAFGAEYEKHLIKMTHSHFPNHRQYEANV